MLDGKKKINLPRSASVPPVRIETLKVLIGVLNSI
jgi:hypothetical protein